MSVVRRLALVLACVVCLVVAATALPAADPRLDTPGESSGENGNWSSVTGTQSDPVSDETTETPADDSDREPRELNVTLGVEGELYPGNTVQITQSGLLPDSEPVVVEVNGQRVGQIDAESTTQFQVPDRESVTLSAPAVDARRTLPVTRTAHVDIGGRTVPSGEATVSATIGSNPLSGATVFVDGESVAETNQDGEAQLSLPETAGEQNVRVERGNISGTNTLTVSEPAVSFVGGIIVPGKKTIVDVTAGGQPVENATVTVADGPERQTDADGRVFVRLPVKDEVTATATVGAETTSTTKSDIYLQTTVIVLLVPSLIIGSIWTYIKLVSRFRFGPGNQSRRSQRRGSRTGVLVQIGDAIARLFDDIGRLFAVLGTGSVGVGRLSMPSGLLPPFSVGFPSLSLGSLLPDPTDEDDPTRSSSWLDRSRTEEGTDETTTATAGDTETPEAESTPPTEQQQLRRAWHAFLDKLGVENRETLTPGEAARRAVRAGYPGDSVGRLLDVFRDIEYGNSDPTADRIEAARQAIDSLADHEPDEPEGDSS